MGQRGHSRCYRDIEFRVWRFLKMEGDLKML